jgi:hypothetical protein
MSNHTIQSMQHWNKVDNLGGFVPVTQDGEDGVELSSDARIVSLVYNHEKKTFRISEQCDGNFYAEYTPQEMVDLLSEAMGWVKTVQIDAK